MRLPVSTSRIILPRLLLACALGLWAAPAGARPRLGVLVIFDQLRTVELDRYEAFFDAGGFGGLDGARFDADYSYAGTETGPGHATLATGANPNRHGIAANSWFIGDERRYVVSDQAVPVWGAPDAKAVNGRSPWALAVPTLGDAMKVESQGRARVVSVSVKDRSALLSVGRTADMALWYEPSLGRYTTSRTYADAMPSWLDELGRALPARAMETGTWDPLPIPKALANLAPVDDRPGEGSHEGLTRTFPHHLKDARPDLKGSLYRLSPQSMDDLFALAMKTLDVYQLGADDEPDLLVVSISTTDHIGHNYGPESLEQLDTLRRADRALRAFVAHVRGKVGRQNVVFAVSSDHGSTPVPKSLPALRADGGIVRYEAVVAAAETAAQAALSQGARRKRVRGFVPPQLFLDVGDLSTADAAKVRGAVEAAVEAIPGVAQVYDLTRAGPEDDYEGLMRNMAFPGRRAELFVRQAPRVVFMEGDDGTDHGTVYTYDRRVPFLLAGPGVTRGRYRVPVDPRDVAPTLAFLMGVPPPDACTGTPVPAVGR